MAHLVTRLLQLPQLRRGQNIVHTLVCRTAEEVFLLRPLRVIDRLEHILNGSLGVLPLGVRCSGIHIACRLHHLLLEAVECRLPLGEQGVAVVGYTPVVEFQTGAVGLYALLV